MGLRDVVRGALDSARAARVERASSGGGGRQRGRHRAPQGGVQCNHNWTTRGSNHTHRCGDQPHNRGDHHCFGGDDWKCTATLPYGQ